MLELIPVDGNRRHVSKIFDTSHYQQFEPPFEIPDSWVWTTLGEIFSMQAGKNIQASGLQGYSKEAPYPCYGGNGIRGYLPKYSHHGTFPIIGRQGALCGNIKVASGFFYATEHAVIVDYFAGTNVDLWTLFLECLNLNQYATATAQPGLSVAKIEEVPIPLPPINEQNRIVDRISKWFSTIDIISKNFNDLKLSIVDAKSKVLELAMQGKLVSQDPSDEPAAEMLKRINPKARIITDTPHSWNIPQSWGWVKLGDIFNHNTGKALNSTNKDGIEYEYITTSNVYWDRFELSGLKKMFFKDSEIEKCMVKHGDLLVCEGGDIGRCAIWNFDKDIMIQNHLHRLRPLANEINPQLYCRLFKLYKEKGLVGGKGIALQGFSSNALHNLVVPLMAENEQKRIVAKIEGLYACLDKIEASLQS